MVIVAVIGWKEQGLGAVDSDDGDGGGGVWGGLEGRPAHPLLTPFLSLRHTKTPLAGGEMERWGEKEDEERGKEEGGKGGKKADDGAGRDRGGRAAGSSSGPSQADQQTGSCRQPTFYNPPNLKVSSNHGRTVKIQRQKQTIGARSRSNDRKG